MFFNYPSSSPTKHQSKSESHQSTTADIMRLQRIYQGELVLVALLLTEVSSFSPTPSFGILRQHEQQEALFAGPVFEEEDEDGYDNFSNMPQDDQPGPGDRFDDEDEEEPEKDPYEMAASEEFMEDASEGGLVFGSGPTTGQDWGAEYGKLRERVAESESGEAQDPSRILFRLMTSETPNQAIGNFIQQANPKVVQAMSGAVTSLLGGLSNPVMGVETVVKASGDKVASLCFQLQMTG